MKRPNWYVVALRDRKSGGTLGCMTRRFGLKRRAEFAANASNEKMSAYDAVVLRYRVFACYLLPEGKR